MNTGMSKFDTLVQFMEWKATACICIFYSLSNRNHVSDTAPGHELQFSVITYIYDTNSYAFTKRFHP